MKERIGIFGCTADPFTLAHREIVKEVLEQKLVDAVIIVPTIVDYHRGDKLPWLSSSEKISAIRALTSDLHPVFVDETELNRKDLIQLSPELQEHAVKNWRFIDTLLRIKLEYMNMHSGLEKEFYPIIGGDSLSNFKTWFAWKDILKQSAGLIAVERNNNQIDAKSFIAENSEFDGKLKAIKICDVFAEMSASDVRETWRNHFLIEYVDWAIAAIEANDKASKKQNNILLHTPIFDVVKGEKTETGLEPVLVKAPDWVTIIVKKDDNVLVEKQLRYGSGCEIEEFPCGMVEKDETPHEAALRELREETGIKVGMKHLVYLGATNPNPAFMTNRMHYFFIDLNYAEWEQAEQKLDEHERITFSWEDLEDFAARIINLAKNRSPKVPAILLSAFTMLDYAFENGIIML